MEETQATPQTQKQEPMYRLEASLVFQQSAWFALHRLRKRFGDKSNAHLIKRALTLLENVEPRAQNDVLYVLDRPPREDEEGVHAIKI